MNYLQFKAWYGRFSQTIALTCLIQAGFLSVLLPSRSLAASIVTKTVVTKTVDFSSSTALPLTVAQLPDPSRTTPDPNRDRLIQPLPIPMPLPPAQTQPTIPSVPAPVPSPSVPTQPEPQLLVKTIEVVGSTVLSPKDWNPIIQPLQGRSVSLTELQQAADSITQLYLDRGYITSRAILVEQAVQDGRVKIQIVEGSVSEIIVEGNQRVRSAYIRSRVGLGAQTPLNRDRLEDQLRLLKADPLFANVEASLRPSTNLGQSVVLVRVIEAKSLSGLIGVDNFSPPSVGSVRLGGALSYRNITGYGDDLGLTYYRTTAGGADTLDLVYRFPVTPQNSTVQFRFAPNWNKIIDPAFKALDIQGSSQLYEVSFRHPIIRNPRQELGLSIGFTSQNGQTFLFSNIPFAFGIGPDADGNSRTRVLKLGQDYVKRDPSGAWALRSQFSLGLGILDATRNDAPIPDGRFFSWLGQVQRVQRFGSSHLVIFQADLQLTPDSLLPSQQFVIGGGQSVRGFRQNARSGDNGFRLSVEDRITFLRDEAGNPIAQIAPFFDMGKVWNTGSNPNIEANQRFLAGAGLGFLWNPYPGLNIRLDYGVPFLRLRDRGNDFQDYGFYFSVNYQF
jgi:hemolysin activation/secretion protein